MRLIKQDIIERDGSGSVTLLPQEPEDMWHAYNLIAVGDTLRASAVRKVTTESATGSTNSKRVHTTISILTTALSFDPQVSQLHVSGRVVEENTFVPMGSYHTLDLELQRNFTLTKKDGWDSVALDMIRESIRVDKEGVVPAVVMQEGLANICLITEYQTVLKQRVEVAIPKKRSGRAGDHDKGLDKFFSVVLETLLRHVDITQPRPLLLASPGFVATGFQKYIINEATRTGNKAILGNKSNFLVVHSSSGHLHSLNEIMKSSAVLSKLKDTKYAKESKYMDDFSTMLRKDDGRAWYGPSEVERAVEKGAVGPGGILLINNNLFRAQEIGVRKRWVRLVDRVKENGGEVRILSSDHESGKRLENLSGIAAILTFPLEDLDESGDEDVGAGAGAAGDGETPMII